MSTARPPDSPIDISSASPTPTRPSLSLPRRSSSRLRDVHEPLGARESHTRTRQAVPEVDEEVMPVPPPRRPDYHVALPPDRHRPPFSQWPTGPARHGLAIPAAPAAGPSRPTQVIDLTEDDDDDIEFTGEVPTVATRRAAIDPRPHQRQRGAEIRARIAAETERYRRQDRQGQEAYAPYDVNAWRDLNQLDQVVEDRGRATEAFLQDREVVVDPPNPVARDNALATLRQRHRRHAVERYHDDNNLPPPPHLDDPPPPPPRARIGLGGAVLRRGNQQINYGAALPARRPDPYPVANLPQYEARLQERVDRVRRAREAQHAGHPDMIANIVQNLMNGGDPNGERMEALLNRLRPAGGFHPAHGPVMEEPSVIIARQPMPEAIDLPEGFTSDFDLNDTIEIDQPKHAKRFMACTKCGDPLYLNDGQKSQDDRVWGLRCGHLLDQKCLHEISSPQVEDDRLNIVRPPPGGLDILGEEGGKAKKRGGYKRKVTKKTVNEPVEYEWKCPVKSCGWGHISILNEAEWKQDEEEGAVQLYV